MKEETTIGIAAVMKGNGVPVVSGLMLLWNGFITALPTIILLLTFVSLVFKLSYDIWRWYQHYKEIKNAAKNWEESKSHQREHQD